jgi:hypothetical protein
VSFGLMPLHLNASLTKSGRMFPQISVEEKCLLP